MQSEIICPNCNQQYRDDNLPRLLVACGHTYCENCLQGFIYAQQAHDHDEGEDTNSKEVLRIKCPEDQCESQLADRNVARFPKNLALIKVIQSKKDSLSFKDNQINVSKITKNSQIQQQQDTNELINIMNSSKSDSSKSNTNKQKQQNYQKQSKQTKKSPKSPKQQICPIHKKPMDIVCIVDLKKICASCAIFGEHRNHTFKSLEEVSQIQADYCGEILSIVKQKQKISKQICCSETKNDILSILSNKKNKMKTKIMDEFQKLQTKLSSKKKQTLKKLDQIVKKQQNNLKNCMKFDDELLKNYEQWNKKSHSQLKILEENDFESKLLLLFQGKNIDGDLVEQGNSIIEHMKIAEENILIQVQKKLQNLSMSVNEDVYDLVDDFIRVSCQSFKQISAIIVKNQPLVIVPPTTTTAPQSQPFIPLLNIGNNPNRRNQIAKYEQGQKQKQKQKRRDQVSKFDENQNSSYLQVSNPTINDALDESLLQNDQQPSSPYVDQFTLRLSCPITSAPLSQRFSIQPNIDIPTSQSNNLEPPKPRSTMLASTIPTFIQSKPQQQKQKLTKKRLSKMKLPERFEKIVQALLADSLEILDLTNAQIGDANISIICQNLPNSKVRTLKLIRNKLTDQGISKILPYLGLITTLNLSQNLITDNILDIMAENKKYLGSLRTVILSQNKIVERKHKSKIDRLKKMDWNVSI